MGSVGLGNNALLGAFLNRTFPEGLDLGRCQINQALGTYVADPTITFNAGSIVSLSATGLVIPSAGTDVLGIAKWNHALVYMAAAVDEVLVLPTGGVDVPLKNANVSNVRVASAVQGGGTIYAIDPPGADYSVNATNGTIRNMAGAIGNNATVYVTYTYQLTQAEVTQMQGTNFWNTLDEVSQNESRVTVITDAELIYTTQYDTSQLYNFTNKSDLYSSVACHGLFTSDPANAAKFVGRVFQVPTASDPFLGLRFIKQAIAI